jgi:hypothetical protein
MRSVVLTFLFISLAILAGCAGDAPSSGTLSKSDDGSRNESPLSTPSSMPASNTAASKPASKSRDVSPEKAAAQLSLDKTAETQAPPTDRKVIQNADLQLESDTPDEVQRQITKIADDMKGYVVEATQSSSDVRANRRDTVTMTVRVPADKFGETLEAIRKSASRVIVETVKSDDVTEEFIDVEARLKAKKSLEAQFLEIMKRANTVDDALNVQSQLSDVRAEIERIEGRLRYLQNQTSLSTVKIRVQTPAAFSNSSKGFFYQLGDSVGRGVDTALSFVLGFVTFAIAILPFLIIVVLPICLLIRYLVRRARKTKTASEIVRDEIGKE